MPHFQRTPGIQNQVSNVKSKSNAFAREPWSFLFLATCKTCLTMSESWPSIEINDTIRTRTRTAFRFRSALWLCSTVQPNKTKKWRKMRKAQRVVIRFLMSFGTCDLASCNFCLQQKHHQSQTKIIYPTIIIGYLGSYMILDMKTKYPQLLWIIIIYPKAWSIDHHNNPTISKQHQRSITNGITTINGSLLSINRARKIKNHPSSIIAIPIVTSKWDLPWIYLWI